MVEQNDNKSNGNGANHKAPLKIEVNTDDITYKDLLEVLSNLSYADFRNVFKVAKSIRRTNGLIDKCFGDLNG